VCPARRWPRRAGASPGPSGTAPPLARRRRRKPAGMGLAIMGDQSRDLAIESDQTGTLGDAALRSEGWPGLLGGVCGKRLVSDDQALLAGAAKLLFGSGDERVQVEAREPRVVGERARERLPQ